MDITKLIVAIRSGKVNFTSHARAELEADELTSDQLYQSVRNGQVIEDYPDDKPFPSCLVFGLTSSGDPVHSVWAFAEEQEIAIVVTAYRPDPSRWIEWKERKK